MSSDDSGTSLPCGLCTFGRRARKSPWAQADTDSWGRAAVSQGRRQLGHRQPASPSARPFLLGALGPDHHPAPSPSLRLPVSRTVARNSQGTAATLADGGNPSGRRQPYVTAATSGWGCSQLPVLVRRSGGAIVSSPFSRRPRQAPRCLRGALVPRRAILTLLWTAFATGGGPRGLPGTNGTYGGQHRASTGQSRAEQSHPSA